MCAAVPGRRKSHRSEENVSSVVKAWGKRGWGLSGRGLSSLFQLELMYSWGLQKPRTFPSTVRKETLSVPQFLQYGLRDALSNPSLCPGLRNSFPSPRVIQRGLRRLAFIFVFTRSVSTYQLHASQYGTGSLGIFLTDLEKEFCVPLEKMDQKGRGWQR